MEILFVKKSLCLDLRNRAHDVIPWCPPLGDLVPVGQVHCVMHVVFCI